MSVRFNSSSWKLTTSLPDDIGFTACGWARLVTDTNNFACIFSMDDASSGYFQVETDSDGTSLLGVGSGGGVYNMATLTAGTDFFWALASSGIAPANNAWYYRTSTSNTFTTGTLSGSRTNFTPTAVWIGNDGFGEPWNGRIWNVKMWTRALTAAELLVESFYSRVMYSSSLLLHWPMRNASDQRDLSGNARVPTVTGTPTSEDEVGLMAPRRRLIQGVGAGGGGGSGATAQARRRRMRTFGTGPFTC